MDPSYSNPAFGAGAGGQPQQPVFGAGGVQVPISSGTGDIMLAPEKKSHKGVIIALILAVLIIGGLFVAVFLMRGGGNSGVSGDAKIAFNKYANYLLYGEDSDKELEEEYDGASEEYAIYGIVAERDKVNNKGEALVDEFFAKADGLWNNFYSNLSDDDLSRMGDYLSEYHENFDFTKLFLTTPKLSDDGFVEKYMTMNESSLNQWIRDRFSKFVNSNYNSIKEYGEKGIQYYVMYADYLKQIRSIGCLDETEKMIIPCEQLDAIGLSSEMIELGNWVNNYENEAISATFDDCWVIERLLNGENVEDANKKKDNEEKK